MKAEQILETAVSVVRAREQQHGNKHMVLTKIAMFWSDYMAVPITAYDVAQMMVLLKVARSQSGEFNADDHVDACGYSALAAEVKQT